MTATHTNLRAFDWHCQRCGCSVSGSRPLHKLCHVCEARKWLKLTGPAGELWLAQYRPKLWRQVNNRPNGAPT